MILTSEDWPGDIYVVVPAFQSVESLTSFLPALLEVVPLSHICVVDDGSSDGTDRICTNLGIGYLHHKKNIGKGAALATGFESLVRRGAEAIISMDADGQHAVDDLSEFVDAFRACPQAGIIIGRRKMDRGHMPFLRVCSNRITSRILSWITDVPIYDSQCGFRLYSSRFLKSITIEYPRYEMESEVILKAAWMHFPIKFVEVQTLYFKNPSHISHRADTLRWIKAVLVVWLSLKRKHPVVN